MIEVSRIFYRTERYNNLHNVIAFQVTKYPAAII
jgi:hypothetical protein